MPPSLQSPNEPSGGQSAETDRRIGAPLRVAMVVAFGEPDPGYFASEFLGMLCTAARENGAESALLRLHYHGEDHEEDDRVRERFVEYLTEFQPDLVVFERLFDTQPIEAYRALAPHMKVAVVRRGDSMDPHPSIDFALGAIVGLTRSGKTARAPTAEELLDVFGGLMGALSSGTDPMAVPGIARVEGGRFLGSALPIGSTSTLPLPALDWEIITPGEPEPVHRVTLLSNVGCPYAGDAAKSLGVSDEGGPEVSKLGCSFCFMGGNYQRTPDDEVVASLVRQALHASQIPSIREFVLMDQYPYRFLASLLYAAKEAGVPPSTWCFAGRCDAFIRQRPLVEAAVAAAAACGYTLDLYLSGFESFCDADLELYKKGITVEEQVQAVEVMRELAEANPGVFEYKKSKAHSLILWHPWTTPERILESALTMRENGLMEVFDEATRNRLRLTSNVPITYAAIRDGAVLPDWKQGDEGTARVRGYGFEKAWRFLDERAALCLALARLLRRHIGNTATLSSLVASAEYAMTPREPDAEQTIDKALKELADLVNAFNSNRSSGTRPRRRRPAVVKFGGACNNGCQGCTNRDRWRPAGLGEFQAQIATARESDGPILLCGREPTAIPQFQTLVRAASGTEQREIGVVSNGRMFAVRGFAVEAVKGGLRAASIKLFGATPEGADSYSRAPRGFEQACAGIRRLVHTKIPNVEVRFVPHALSIDETTRMPALVRELGAHQLRVDLALDAIGLENLARLTTALAELIETCEREALPLSITPLSAGTTQEQWINL